MNVKCIEYLMSYDQSNGQCRCNGKKAIWKYKSTASTDFQATLKKGSHACFGNLMSLERSTCNFIYKSLQIWNQICFHSHFKALLVKSFLEKKTYHDTNCDKQNPHINDIYERPKVFISGFTSIFLFTGIAWVWKTILCTYGLRRVRLCCGPHHLKAKQLPQGELLGHPQQGT